MKKGILFLFALFVLVATFFLMDFFEGIEVQEEVIAEEFYDVIVIGTDPEGIAAAVSSARNGMKTLLIDNRKRLGGLMTVGGLNTIDMNYNPQGELITRGIFEEFFEQIEGDSFVVKTAENVFNKMVNEEENIVLAMETEIIDVIMNGNLIIGINAIKNEKSKSYYGDRIIDATQNADIAYMAGVPYSIGMEDYGVEKEYQVVTLIFELDNIDWDKICKHLENDEDIYSGAGKHSAAGFKEEMHRFVAEDPNIRVRGLNIGRQSETSVLINALHIFNVNPLDKESIEAGKERAIKEIPNIVEHMKKYLAGFENAEFVGVAEELYLRESRHIYGEYRLTINDVLEHRDFWDRIALASYPADIQSTSMQNWGYVIGNPAKYSIPFRSIVPLEVENLLVVGRSASFDSLAHGSARVIPIGMAIGEAAGVASAYSINNKKSFRDISREKSDINKIQERLIKQGAYLEYNEYPYSTKGHWAEEGLRFIRSKGVVFGGYANDYQLENLIIAQRLENVFNAVMTRSFPGDFTREDLIKINPHVSFNTDKVKKEDIATMLLRDYLKIEGVENHYQYLVENEIISATTAANIEDIDLITNAALYSILYDFINYLEKN